MANKGFLDWSIFTDALSGLELFSNSIRKTLRFDAYAGKKRFKARVLTNAVYLSEEMVNATNPDPGLPATVQENAIYATFQYKARILGDDSPHGFLPDPCTTYYEDHPGEAISIMAMHTTFVSNYELGKNTASQRKPVAGQIVWVELKSSNNIFNLQTGLHLGIAETQPATGPDTIICSPGDAFAAGLRGDKRAMSEFQQAGRSSGTVTAYTSDEQKTFCDAVGYPNTTECAKYGDFFGPPYASVVAPHIGYGHSDAASKGLSKRGMINPPSLDAPFDYRDKQSIRDGATDAAMAGGFIIPYTGKITSPYDAQRSYGDHGALDFGAPNYSSPPQHSTKRSPRDDGASGGMNPGKFLGAVIAPQAGVILSVSPASSLRFDSSQGDNGKWSPNCGIAIKLECDTNPKTQWLFCHLDSVARLGGEPLRAGMTVKRGQVLGRVGTTGHCVPEFGPHLHLELSYEGPSGFRRADPMTYCGWNLAYSVSSGALAAKGTVLHRGWGAGRFLVEAQDTDTDSIVSGGGPAASPQPSG